MKRFLIFTSVLITIAIVLLLSCTCIKTPTKSYDKELSVSLPANPTTGYQWEVQVEGAGYKVEDTYYEAPKGNLVGAGGTWHGIFSGFEEGSTTITLSYKRSWDVHSTVEERIYRVLADKDGNILSLTEESKTF